MLAHALPRRPERRAARIRATIDEQAFIDGQPVTLIDLSVAGAQVRSHMVLRPQQRIRLVLPPERGSVKAVAVVAWSSFEIGPTPTYRAGVAFTQSDPRSRLSGGFSGLCGLRLRVTAARLLGLAPPTDLEQGETCNDEHRE